MPTSGPLPITPKLGFFPGALTMFNPRESLRFREILDSAADGAWNNTTHIMSSVSSPCSGPAIDKVIHVWKPGPINEGWANIDDCANGDYEIPGLDIPDGTGYYFTISGVVPLYPHILFSVLWDLYHNLRAYAVRYGALWTTVIPTDMTHNIEVIHFNGWPD